MSRLSQLCLVTVASVFCFAASVTPARADIIVMFGVDNTGTDNVLLNPSANALTAIGTFGTTDRVVEFTSSSGSGLLSANPSGAATVSGGTGNTPLSEITFGVDSDAFTRAVFNINAFSDGDVLINIEGYNITGGFFEDSFTVDANGQNFFTVSAILGQSMTSISLTGINGATFQDIRQVRLGGSVENLAPVPEPASMMLLGTGLTALVAARRRRQKKQHEHDSADIS